MTTKQKCTIYDEVSRFTHDYFGSEAIQYIDKLIEIHLSKPPELLTKEELVSLIDWIRGAASFLVEDSDVVEKYVTDLFHIASNTKSSNNSSASGDIELAGDQ